MREKERRERGKSYKQGKTARGEVEMDKRVRGCDGVKGKS